MPSRLDSPVLSLSINNISKIDTHNVDNLFGMWTIFSRCAESLENGRRLENLSWRLWNQETFYTGTVSKFRASQEPEATAESSASTRSRSSTSSTEDVPALSSSVESASSTDRYPHSSVHSNQSTLSRRGSGKERHINPIGLARLMSNLNNNEVEQLIEEHAKSPVKQPAKPIDVPVAPVTTVAREVQKASTDSTSSSGDSADSHCSIKSSHSVVRGFGPGLVSNSYRSSTKLAPEVTLKEEKKIDAKGELAKPKKGGMFIVGSSPSDASGSYEGSRYGSALSNSLRRVASSGSKRAAFVEEVQTRTIVREEDEDFITDDEEDVSDSAIDEDDWDSVSEEGSSYTEENMFARIEEPRPQLTSRRSLLSTLLHQDDRAAALARAGTRSAPAIRSRTASPNGPSMPASPVREAPLQQQIMGARAVPMVKSASAFPQALSPRTTRRNMLATELTESLRKHLLWERQQKNKVANAVLRRRHTAYDMQNMTQYPQTTDRAGSWNNQFEHGGNEYHLAGW
ncbi:hypothetical protein H072_4051 [Dactylellina haptotyla CBS 200.50]|uniref:Uncharacterized protein n=1 Tax=Dactylellina haptotyla (strain CBS 200.50) TaxID=1284197 RepID=S8ALP4_DACHA|nr:hypothetical protein H072_4051 [Dactylellina haptotyla CBS 200.50]